MVVFGDTREATRDKVTGRKAIELPLKYFRVAEVSSLAETTDTEAGEESFSSRSSGEVSVLAVDEQSAYEEPMIVDTRNEMIITA